MKYDRILMISFKRLKKLPFGNNKKEQYEQIPIKFEGKIKPNSMSVGGIHESVGNIYFNNIFNIYII